MLEYLLKDEAIPAWIIALVKDNITVVDPLLTVKTVKIIPYFASSRSLINFENYINGIPTAELPKNYLDLFMSQKVKISGKNEILSFIAHRCAARKFMLPEISAIDIFHMAVIDFRNHGNSLYFNEDNATMFADIIDQIAKISTEVFNSTVDEIDNLCHFSEQHEELIKTLGEYVMPTKSDIEKITQKRMLTNRDLVRRNYNPNLNKTENANLLGMTTKTLNSHLKALGMLKTREHKVDEGLIVKCFDANKNIAQNYKNSKIQATKIAYNTYYKAVCKLGLIGTKQTEPIIAPCQPETVQDICLPAEQPQSLPDVSETAHIETRTTNNHVLNPKIACPTGISGTLAMPKFEFNIDMSMSGIEEPKIKVQTLDDVKKSNKKETENLF